MAIFQKIEDWLEKEEEEKDDLLTCVALPQVKTASKSRVCKRALSERTIPTKLVPLSWEISLKVHQNHTLEENNLHFLVT